MANVKTIYVRVVTKDIENAGTDGDIYVGIGGTVFHLDSKGDYNDFERGDDRTYILGELPSMPPDNSTAIQNPTANDPQQPYALKTENLNDYPVYIRLDEARFDSYWALDFVEIRVNPDDDNIVFNALEDEKEYLWFGWNWGFTLYLQGKPNV